jgi:hypothetical protein
MVKNGIYGEYEGGHEYIRHLVGKPNEYKQICRPERRLEGNIKMHLKKIE